MKRIYPAFLLWLTSMGTMAQGAPAFTFENESALSPSGQLREANFLLVANIIKMVRNHCVGRLRTEM